MREPARVQTSATSSRGDVPPPSREPNPVWVWFTTGNVLTRIGVVALFFGIGFLLKYLAEIVTIPIEVKLLAVAAVGAALVLLGARLARTRPGYGLSLEGAGAGVLYLTTFAAFRLYDVLPATLAFALLIAIAVLTVWMAIREDSQPLAALAIAGGFLAPILVATTPGEPALLFGYFLVLNAAILAIALVRAWRALNVLGFVFTFVLGLFWGDRYYQPEHFATVEPFLAVFFAFYLAIAILYAKRGSLVAKAPVDAILVFGVPLVGLALQAAMVRDTQYGVAYSALAMAAVYAVLWLALAPPPGARPRPAVARVLRARGDPRDRGHSVRRGPAMDVGVVGARVGGRVLDRLPPEATPRPRVRAAPPARRCARICHGRIRARRAAVPQCHLLRQHPDRHCRARHRVPRDAPP